MERHWSLKPSVLAIVFATSVWQCQLNSVCSCAILVCKALVSMIVKVHARQHLVRALVRENERGFLAHCVRSEGLERRHATFYRFRPNVPLLPTPLTACFSRFPVIVLSPVSGAPRAIAKVW